MVHSGAARAAVENMMKTLSIEWSRFNIKLCAIAVGQFDTETLRTKYPPEISKNVARTVPLQRMGREEEMGWLVAFLASPAGDFFSGCVITFDGARDNWFGAWPPGDATGTRASSRPKSVSRKTRRTSSSPQSVRGPLRMTRGPRLPKISLQHQEDRCGCKTGAVLQSLSGDGREEEGRDRRGTTHTGASPGLLY